MKTCNDCQDALILGQNWTKAAAKNHIPYCRYCWNKRMMIGKKKYIDAGFCRDGCGRKIETKTRCDTCAEKLANILCLRNYGITLEQKRQMWRDQNGRCALCKEEMLTSKDCNVDHHHKSGKIRGLLCSSCNKGLGFFKENPLILQSAIQYLTVSTYNAPQ